jgi:hypothetical protein
MQHHLETYTTLDGKAIDLRSLSTAEARFAETLLSNFRAGWEWRRFSNLVSSSENPSVSRAGGRITRELWDDPLFLFARDLEDRLGITQGHLKVPPGVGMEVDADPFRDEWIPVAEAARRKGVTRQAIYGAARSGQLISCSKGAGRVQTLISLNSVSVWKPSELRQAARKRVSMNA